MKDFDYSQSSKSLDLHSVEGRLLKHDIEYWQIFQEHLSISWDNIFSHSLLGSTRGHNFQITHSRTQLESRKRFFTLRCVDLWNALPTKLVGCGNTEVFKHSLALHLGDLLFHYASETVYGTIICCWLKCHQPVTFVAVSFII